MLRRIATGLTISVIMLGAALVGLTYWTDQNFREPGPLSDDTILVIQPGTGLSTIARQLTEAGVIGYQQLFIAKLRLDGTHRQLKAGEYFFPAGISQEAVTEKLLNNDVVARRVTIPEGLTVREIIAILDRLDGLTGPIEQFPTEGSLLPETYSYQRGENRAALLMRMESAMAKILADLWPSRQEGLPLDTPEQALVLASIVEKETGVAGERAKIAGVFINRLRKGMRLQSDPTVIYALTEGKRDLGRALTRKDWRLEHPYNTYSRAGLPPGPITNPGRDAIRAVLHPAATKALYFVADGTGGHAFATTLRDHNRNVAKWRKIRDGQ